MIYLFTLLFHVDLYLNGGKTNDDNQNLLGTAMLVPILTVIIVQKLIYKDRIVERLGISFNINKWFFITIILPIVMTVILHSIIKIFYSDANFTINGVVKSYGLLFLLAL